ncbi:MAG: hypothetical protein ABI132_04460 [Rhodanobacteraceae bacterium]
MSFVAAIRKAWQNTKEMPSLLRIYCRAAMVVAPLLLMFLIHPLREWIVNGKAMSYREFWSSGVGVSLGVLIVLIAIGGWGEHRSQARGKGAHVRAQGSASSRRRALGEKRSEVETTRCRRDQRVQAQWFWLLLPKQK